MKLKKGQLIIVMEDLRFKYGFSPGYVGKLAFGEKQSSEYLKQFDAFKKRNIEDDFYLLDLPEAIIRRVEFLNDLRNMLNNYKEKELGNNFFIYARRIIFPIPKHIARPPYPSEIGIVHRLWNKTKKGEI